LDDKIERQSPTIVRPTFKQRDLEAERQQNLKDAARIADLIAELRAELDRTNEGVTSAAAATQAAEIEKLIKAIRRRLR